MKPVVRAKFGMSTSQNHSFVSKGFVGNDARKPFELHLKHAELVGKRFKQGSGVGAVLNLPYGCVHGGEEFDSQALPSNLTPSSRGHRFVLGVWMNSERMVIAASTRSACWPEHRPSLRAEQFRFGSTRDAVQSRQPRQHQRRRQRATLQGSVPVRVRFRHAHFPEAEGPD
jgi:hypothetical protein